MRETAATENARIDGNSATQDGDELWLKLSRDAYDSSQDYFNSSLRREFEDSQAHFGNRHAPGSKYLHPSYRKKSKTFRPKTRSVIRQNEMALAVAMFSTQDVVHVSPVNEADDDQVLAAEIKNQILNFRLNQPEMNWFLTCIGGGQEAMNIGAIISKQYWRFRERKSPTTRVTQRDDGHFDVEVEGTPEVIEDRPCIDLVPIENLRIHQASDWRDPIGSSPFVIEITSMTVQDVRLKAKTPNMLNPEEMEYRDVDDIVMRASIERDWDSVRKIREGHRVDRYHQQSGKINDFKTVWVHKNIVRIDGFDYCYDTLGPDTILSRTVRPIEAVYLTGDRPYSYGVSVIEAHKLFPSGIPRLTFHSQEYANDIANLRQDNLRLTLNRRYWVRRGAQVDILSLRRNTAGGVTLMNNPASDVKESATPDVTGSSYEEQDRINADFDDIAGSFSQSSVNTNRKLNETVGGMEMLNNAGNMMQEYMVRTIVETWAERAIRQVLRMCERYESDVELLTMVAAKHDLDIETVLYLLQLPTEVHVNAGFGSTNPTKRIEKLALGLGVFRDFFPEVLQGADRREVGREVFGALGYRDGSRFLPTLYEDQVDPQVQALQQEVAQLRQALESKQMEVQGRITVAEIGAMSREAVARMKAEVDVMKQESQDDMDAFREQMKARFDDINVRLAAAKEERERMSLMLEREALSHSIIESDREFALQMRTRNAEADGAMNLKGEDKAGIISRQDYGAIPDSPR